MQAIRDEKIADAHREFEEDLEKALLHNSFYQGLDPGSWGGTNVATINCLWFVDGIVCWMLFYNRAQKDKMTSESTIQQSII